MRHEAWTAQYVAALAVRRVVAELRRKELADLCERIRMLQAAGLPTRRDERLTALLKATSS
jgi:hypothetical protein